MSPTPTGLVQLLPLAKDLDENKVTPGVLGFIVFAAMGIAVWMLMKSMHRHMKKVDFEERPPAAGTSSAVPAPGSAPEAEPERASAAPASKDDAKRPDSGV
ncbi:MAG TPA: hypothetical protein VGO89_11745 [Streptomyces sp.]|nr:hypothetical protein [Streptomyces sp.]